MDGPADTPRAATAALGFLTCPDGPPVVNEYARQLLEALLDVGSAVTLLSPVSSPTSHGAWRRAAKRCQVAGLRWERDRLDARSVVTFCRRSAIRHLLIPYHPACLALGALTALVEECAEHRIRCAVVLHGSRNLTADGLHPLDRAGTTLVVPTASARDHFLDRGIVNVVAIPPGVPGCPPESVQAARAHFGLAQGPVIGVAGDFGSTHEVLLETAAILRELYSDLLLFRPVDRDAAPAEGARTPWGLLVEERQLTRNVCLSTPCDDAREMVVAFRACDLILLVCGQDEDATLAAAHLAVAARRPLAALPPWDALELGEAVYPIESTRPPVVALAAANILSSEVLQRALVSRAERYALGKGWQETAAGFRRILLGREVSVAA